MLELTPPESLDERSVIQPADQVAPERVLPSDDSLAARVPRSELPELWQSSWQLWMLEPRNRSEARVPPLSWLSVEQQKPLLWAPKPHSDVL